MVCTSWSPSSVMPLPSTHLPSVTTSLFSVFVGLFLFCYICLFLFLDSVCNWERTVFIFLWHFPKHSILHVHLCCCRWQKFIPFFTFECAHTHTHTHTPHIIFIHSSVDGHDTQVASMEGLQKIKNRITVRSSSLTNITLRCLARENENTDRKRSVLLLN